MESDSYSTTDANPWPYLSDFVNFVSRSGGKILFECKRCLPKKTTIRAHTSSLNNLKQHIRRVHESQYVEFEETVKVGSNRGKQKRKSNISYSDNGYYNDIVSINNAAKRIRQTGPISNEESFGIAATGSGVSQLSADQCMMLPNWHANTSQPVLTKDASNLTRLDPGPQLLTHVIKTEPLDIDIDPLSDTEEVLDRNDLGGVPDVASNSGVKTEAVEKSCETDYERSPGYTRLLEAILSSVSRQEQSATRAAHAQEKLVLLQESLVRTQEAQTRALEKIAHLLEERSQRL